jgi:hypothetical protein
MKPKRAVDSNEARLRTIAIVMVACLVLAVGILLATSPGGSRGPGITAQSSEPTDAESAPASQPVQTQKLEEVQAPPLSIYRRRNIFKPLVSIEGAQETGQTTTTTTGTAGAAAPSYITLPPELDPGGASAGTVLSTAITLEGVFEQEGKLFARIRVGDALFEKVAVGEVFGGNYKLLALGRDSSAEVLYGDERFTIFTGQSLYW